MPSRKTICVLSVELGFKKMTISYSGNFAKLLLRWKGSVWKTTWKELTGWLFLYYVVRIIYRYSLNVEQKTVFEKIITEFDDYTKRIPLTFILGFYVATVVKRWWEQFQHVAWPDSCLHALCFFMHPSTTANTNRDDQEAAAKETLQRRRTIARYLNLCACLAYRDISVRVRKRFPTLEHLIKAQLMTGDELEIYRRAVDCSRWFLPLQWTHELVEDYCRKHVVPAPYVAQFLTRMYEYRLSFHKLFCYDWICIPLVYTQVSALATYGYFFMCFIGRQFIETRTYMPIQSDFNTTTMVPSNCTRNCYDYYVPVFSIVEFLFYVGWFKVAQDIMRPFEEDDDDYELNYILDRNIRISVSIANSCLDEKPAFPPSTSLEFWENAGAADLPYTKLSNPKSNHPPKMHAYVAVKKEEDFETVQHRNFDERDRSGSMANFLKHGKTKRWRYF